MCVRVCVRVRVRVCERETDRQTDRQTETERKTDRQKQKNIRQADTETERQKQRQTEKEKEGENVCVAEGVRLLHSVQKINDVWLPILLFMSYSKHRTASSLKTNLFQELTTFSVFRQF